MSSAQQMLRCLESSNGCQTGKHCDVGSPSAPSLTAVRRALPLAELSGSGARGIGFLRLTAQRRRAVLLLLLATAAAAAAGQQQQRRPRQQQLRQESHLCLQHNGLINGSSSSSTSKNEGTPATFNFLRGPPKPRGEVTDTLALHTLDEPKQSVNLEVATRCDAPHHARAEARRSCA